MLPKASVLTRDHRVAQLKLVRLIQLQSAANWSVMDFADLDASSLEWLSRQSQIVLAGRERAAVQAAKTYQDMRVAQIGERLAVQPSSAVGANAVTQTVTSLRVSGPVAVKQSVARGSTPAKAMSDGLSSVLSATQRLVMAGDRSMFINMLGMESSTVYYERVTGGANPCDWCLMLSGRGAVYTADTADFPAHDNCSCSIQPKFRGRKLTSSQGYVDVRRIGDVSGPAVPITGAPEQ